MSPNVLVRADIPYLHVDPDADGIDSETGYGNVFLRLGWRAINKPTFALFFGGDFVLDTAVEDVVGGGTDLAIPLVAPIWVLPEHKAIAGVVLSHAVDIGGSDRKDDSETEIRSLFV